MTQMDRTTNVLVLGASGMLGNAVFRMFAQSPAIDVRGSIRGQDQLRFFAEDQREHIVSGVDVENPDHLLALLDRSRPDVIINCIGLVKQHATASDPLAALPINALLPHRLARAAALIDARLVHVSTDCVFAGTRGNYLESDIPDAYDLYGRSKLLGEVDYPHAVTLRTSIIGHELASARGLVGWFLAQQGRVPGFTRAVFSGLPTVELARVIRDYVIPDDGMHGLYHVSAAPIAKYDLLRLLADAYGRDVEIVADDGLVIDRSLDSSRFRNKTGYQPPSWSALIERMKGFG